METQCAVSKPQNSNNHWPRAWTKEQRKILHFCLRGSHKIFLKHRFSLISTSVLQREPFSHGTYRVHCRREGVMWRRGLKWRNDWSTAGHLGPYGGIIWRDTMQLQPHHGWLRPPAKEEPEGMWLPERAVRHGWQQHTQKEKMLWGNGNHGGAATRTHIYQRGKWEMFSTMF